MIYKTLSRFEFEDEFEPEDFSFHALQYLYDHYNEEEVEFDRYEFLETWVEYKDEDEALGVYGAEDLEELEDLVFIVERLENGNILIRDC